MVATHDSATFPAVLHADLKLIGGSLALDFTNTRSDGVDWLEGYPELVAWSRLVGLLDDSEARELREAAQRDSEQARRVVRRALRLRSSLRRVFAALAADKKAAMLDLTLLNRELACANRRLQLGSGPAGFVIEFEHDGAALDRMLWPVAQEAVELLTSEDHTRIKQCGADSCDWLFLDTSRNRSRRWCDMKACGNRAKARRHYARERRREERESRRR